MKKIKDIILSDKTPMDKNSLWLKDGNLKYFEGVWKNIDTSKMLTNTSDIILDFEKCSTENKNDDIKYLKNFIEQGETWAKNNGTYESNASEAVFSFPVLMKDHYILIPSVAYSLNNETVVFTKSQYIYYPDIDSIGENDIFVNQSCIVTGKITIDLNKSNYFENTLDMDSEDLTARLLKISFTDNNQTQLSRKSLLAIRKELDNGPCSCILNGVVVSCRLSDGFNDGFKDNIIITSFIKYGNPKVDTLGGKAEENIYKNYDSIFNLLIDSESGRVLRKNQQVNGPIAGMSASPGMVKQMPKIPALPPYATLATVIDSYNTLLTKLQDAYMMAKKEN